MVVVALAGCAMLEPRITAGRLHQVCEQEYPQFVQTARCIEGVMKDPDLPSRARSDTTLQLFAAYAGALANRVSTREMDESEARYRLTDMRMRIEREQQARADAAGDALMRHYMEAERARTSRGRVITCSSMWGMINCS